MCVYLLNCTFVCVCVCITSIKLHITAQSGPVILVILCHSHGSSQGGINDVCVCVCVFCHPIYSGHQTCGRTSRGHTGGMSHRISPPSFCGACLNFSREKGSAIPLPPSTVKSNFVYSRTDCSPLVGHDVRKTPSSYDCAEIRTHVPTSEGFEVTN